MIRKYHLDALSNPIIFLFIGSFILAAAAWLIALFVLALRFRAREVGIRGGLIVAIALKCMSLTSQEIIGYHYIARCYDPTTWSAFKRPMKQGLVAKRMGISPAEYYQRRDTAKACVRTALSLDTKALASARLSMVESDQMQELPLHP